MKKSYLFIHGAWHGSWCWERFTPTLASHRSCHILTPDLPEQANLRDCVNFLKNSLTSPVTLVAHSLAGVIATQLAEDAPELIEEIIYIAAYVPQNQHSAQNEIDISQSPGKLNQDIHVSEKSILLKPSHNVQQVLYTNCSNDIAQQSLLKLRPEPLSRFLDTVTITAERFGMVSKKYILCQQDQAVHPDDQARMSSRLTNCRIIQRPFDHSPHLSNPEELFRFF